MPTALLPFTDAGPASSGGPSRVAGPASVARPQLILPRPPTARSGGVPTASPRFFLPTGTHPPPPLRHCAGASLSTGSTMHSLRPSQKAWGSALGLHASITSPSPGAVSHTASTRSSTKVTLSKGDALWTARPGLPRRSALLGWLYK
jgi:hypothetical protein